MLLKVKFETKERIIKTNQLFLSNCENKLRNKIEAETKRDLSDAVIFMEEQEIDLDHIKLDLQKK